MQTRIKNTPKEVLKVIPKGDYCYTRKDEKRISCPFWFQIKSLPEQTNGYCVLLGKSDIDINKGASGWLTNYDQKTGKKHRKYIKRGSFPFPVGLLWDQVKECGL